MNLFEENEEVTLKIVLKQLKNYWDDIDENVIFEAIPKVLINMEKGFSDIYCKYFYDEKLCKSSLSPIISSQWMIFLYRLSHQIFIDGKGKVPKEADLVYYLNKILHSNDWFYAIDLPLHFMVEHPLGSVLGRATYGDYFCILQGTTVGGNRSKGKIYYPQIGNNVMMFANSSIIGNTTIGDNVIISAGTQIVNDSVPSNCIVFGQSPNLVIKNKTEEDIKKYSQHIWRWEI